MKDDCGNPKCKCSTAIDNVTITFGSGGLDPYGFWEKPCIKCAEAWKKAYPDDPVWPKTKEDVRMEVLMKKLIDRVLEHIVKNVNEEDLTAIEELLAFVPLENLVGFLPEEEWEEFDKELLE